MDDQAADRRADREGEHEDDVQGRVCLPLRGLPFLFGDLRGTRPYERRGRHRRHAVDRDQHEHAGKPEAPEQRRQPEREQALQQVEHGQPATAARALDPRHRKRCEQRREQAPGDEEAGCGDGAVGVIVDADCERYVSEPGAQFVYRVRNQHPPQAG